MVRTVKEVLKKFLLDPALMELKLEDLINLFLFNYRNTASSEGDFPSEKLFSFKPKTLVDLINPKNSYKKLLSTPQTDDGDYPTTELAKQLDPLEKLTEGDEVWFRNHNPNVKERWLKAIFDQYISDYHWKRNSHGSSGPAEPNEQR